jgi:hypothetical protein
MKPTTIPIPAIVLIAVAAFAFAGAGEAIDIRNSYWFGLTHISEEAALMFGLASASLILIPLLMLVPSAPKTVLWVAYVALMAFAGTCNYYANDAHGKLTANGPANQHKEYITATKKRDDANLAISINNESGKVANLSAQVADAVKTVGDVSKDLAVCGDYPYSKRCAAAKAAKADAQGKLDTLRERLSMAETRDEAKATLAKAEAALAGGDVIVPDHDGKMDILLALVTLGMTFFAKIGASAIAYALSSGKPAKAKPRKADGGNNGGGIRESGNVVNMHRWTAQKMLDDATEAGSGIRGSAFHKAYVRTAKLSIAPGELRAVLEAILPAGSISDRNSGWVIKGLRLKTATERKQERKAATC